MVSGWISLNVEPKTYRTGEDTAASQLREQGRKITAIVLRFSCGVTSLDYCVYDILLILFSCMCVSLPPAPSSLPFEVVGPKVPLRPWWMEMDIIVLGTVGCASVVFLLSAIIICYKAIKRLDVNILFSVPVRSYCHLSLKYLKMRTNLNWNCHRQVTQHIMCNLTHGKLYHLSWLCC